MESSCPAQQPHRERPPGPGQRRKGKGPGWGGRKSLEAPSAAAAPFQPLLCSASSWRWPRSSYQPLTSSCPFLMLVHTGAVSPQGTQGDPETGTAHAGEMPAMPMGCAELWAHGTSLVWDTGTVQPSRVTLRTSPESQAGDATILPADSEAWAASASSSSLPTPQPAQSHGREQRGQPSEQIPPQPGLQRLAWTGREPLV